MRYWQLAVQTYLHVIKCFCHHYPAKLTGGLFKLATIILFALWRAYCLRERAKVSVSFKWFVNSTELICREMRVFLYLWGFLPPLYSDIHFQNLFLEKLYHFFVFESKCQSAKTGNTKMPDIPLNKKSWSMEASWHLNYKYLKYYVILITFWINYFENYSHYCMVNTGLESAL